MNNSIGICDIADVYFENDGQMVLNQRHSCLEAETLTIRSLHIRYNNKYTVYYVNYLHLSINQIPSMVCLLCRSYGVLYVCFVGLELLGFGG